MKDWLSKKPIDGKTQLRKDRNSRRSPLRSKKRTKRSWNLALKPTRDRRKNEQRKEATFDTELYIWNYQPSQSQKLNFIHELLSLIRAWSPQLSFLIILSVFLTARFWSKQIGPYILKKRKRAKFLKIQNTPERQYAWWRISIIID